MRRSCTEEMSHLRKVVSDNRCKKDQILRGACAGDKLGRTCRQVGNLKGREQRELADDHPIKAIYTRRMNTITQYLHRGTLDEQTAAVMKLMAKDKLERAIEDVAYANGSYEKKMEQTALLEEAGARTPIERKIA